MITDNQLQAFNKIISLEPAQRVLIEGEGGAGKTYTAMQAILQTGSSRIALVAPTHSAKETLFTKLSELAQQELTAEEQLSLMNSVSCFTSAGFCGRFLIENTESGELYDGSTESSKAMQSWDLVVLDEVSLTPTKDVMHMLECSEAWPFVLMGDRNQCQAIKQGESPVFDTKFCEDNDIAYEFIKGNMRNDGEIRAITKHCQGNSPFYPEADSQENTVFGDANSLAESFIDSVTEAWQNGEADWGLNYAFIAYTNKRVNSIAEELRARMFGSADNIWHKGEFIRVNATVMLIEEAGELKPIKIEDCKFEFTVQSLLLRNVTTGKTDLLNVLCPDQLAVYNSAKEYYQSAGDSAKSSDRQLANYFWGIRSSITRNITTATLACCITAIKSQSRTIANVWVDTADIKRWAANKGKILFTAYGRCAEHLHTVLIPKPIATPYQKFCTACRKAGVRRMAASRYQAYSAGLVPDKLKGLSMTEIENRHISYWLAN